MFKNLQLELERLAQTTEISIPLAVDADGYADKECPAEQCLFQFKIQEDDWKDIVRDEEMFCPSCGHAAPATSWFTIAQIEAAKEHAVGQVTNALNGAMRADAAASKQRANRDSFLNLTLEVKDGHDAVLLPIAAAEPMRLRTRCEECGCRYSYVGAAFFCPSCGKNSASHTFAQTLMTIRIAAKLGKTLQEALGPDEADLMSRSLLEKAMQDSVMSFQRLSEQLYERRGLTARRNAFQSLETGSELWKAEMGVAYADLLTIEEMSAIRIGYQQRHILAHKQGIVDADYIARSGDSQYTAGQRIVIAMPSVLNFANVIEKLGNQLIVRSKL